MKSLYVNFKINHIDKDVIFAQSSPLIGAYFFKDEQAYRDLIKAFVEIGDRIDFSISSQKTTGFYHIDNIKKWEQKNVS